MADRQNRLAKPILYLSYLGGLGGGERSLRSLIQHLDREQFLPYVICGRDGMFVSDLRADGIRVEVAPFELPRRTGRIIPRFTWGLFFRLFMRVMRQRTALIHCNDLASAFYAAPVAWLLHRPIVWTCHGVWHVDEGWKGWFYENGITRIIAVTSSIQRALLAVAPQLDAHKVHIIPLGVDVNQFCPEVRDTRIREEFAIPLDAPVVTMIARFQPLKGHKDLLDAAEHILKRFPETRFLIVGDNTFGVPSDEENKEAIHQYVYQNDHLRSRVIFTGFRRDIPEILANTDIVVCPSHYESFGMVQLEAMASAKPVVSTNMGGPSETMLDRLTGLLVPPHDPFAIADSVCRLLAEPMWARELGSHARQHVVQSFSIRTVVQQVEQLYSDLVG